MSRRAGRWSGAASAGILLSQVGLLVVVLAYWEWGPLDVSVFSRPSDIVARLYEDFTSGRIWVHLSATLQEVVFGYLFGVVSGVLLAYALHLLPRTRAVLQPYLVALQGLPKVAIAPLFILALGIGVESKIVIAASLVFFLMFFNTSLGLSMVDEEYLNIAKVIGASRLELARRVQFPSTLPFIMNGLRVSLPYAVIGAIIGEFIASQHGLGVLILTATTQLDTAGTFAGVVLLLLIVLVGNTLLGWLEAKATPWSNSSRKSNTTAM